MISSLKVLCGATQEEEEFTTVTSTESESFQATLSEDSTPGSCNKVSTSCIRMRKSLCPSSAIANKQKKEEKRKEGKKDVRNF